MIEKYDFSLFNQCHREKMDLVLCSIIFLGKIIEDSSLRYSEISEILIEKDIGILSMSRLREIFSQVREYDVLTIDVGENPQMNELQGETNTNI
jgi:hypothetical protein